MGTVGDCFDNAMMESFWARMQVELLDRRRWSTRIELANAVFEYLEVFHNRQRRHTALGMRTPHRIRKHPLTEHNPQTTDPSELTPQNWGTIINSRATLGGRARLLGTLDEHKEPRPVRWPSEAVAVGLLTVLVIDTPGSAGCP